MFIFKIKNSHILKFYFWVKKLNLCFEILKTAKKKNIKKEKHGAIMGRPNTQSRMCGPIVWSASHTIALCYFVGPSAPSCSCPYTTRWQWLCAGTGSVLHGYALASIPCSSRFYHLPPPPPPPPRPQIARSAAGRRKDGMVRFGSEDRAMGSNYLQILLSFLTVVNCIPLFVSSYLSANFRSDRSSRNTWGWRASSCWWG
jgi:hypothetical protein